MVSMHKTNVLITIDTEHSIGGALTDPMFKPVGNDRRIFGRFNGKEYGIPLIMDIADSYGIPLTFFVEVLNKYYFGESETREVCEYIIERGHDVQLHLHPGWLNFTEPNHEYLRHKDNMAFYNAEQQSRMIGEGKALLMEYGVKKPIAFRAGNFGADHNTLQALTENGFKYDSSYNMAYQHTMAEVKKNSRINDMTIMGSITEIPVTCFQEHIPFVCRRIKPLDINGTGFAEIRETLEFATKKRFKCVTIILHSFSFYRTKDPQYHSVRIMQPVIKRFRKLCHYLNQEKDRFDSTCFKYSPMLDMKIPEVDSNNIPKASTRHTLFRYAEQAIGLL